MPIYAYKAIDRSGQRQRGVMDVANLAELERRLQAVGQDLIRTRPAHALFRPRQPSLSSHERIHFCFHLAHSLKAGLPLLESLHDMQSQFKHSALASLASDLRARIDAGASFSQALDAHPDSFDAVFCAMVRAAELSGNLPAVLGALNESLKRQDEMRAQLGRALLYPGFVLIVSLIAVNTALLYVVPELSKLFQATGQTLPLHTRALLITSSLLSAHGPGLLLVIAATGVLGSLCWRWHHGTRRFFDRSLLRLPLIGTLYEKALLARFISVFAMMYGAGITILDGIQSARALIINRELAASLQDVEQHIREGHTLEQAFSHSARLPSLVCRMLGLGERSGSLDEALQNICYFYERDLAAALARLQSLLEPVLLLVLGTLILWIALAVLGPVYDLIGNMKV